MKKYFVLFVIIVPIWGFTQNGFYLVHHQMASGTDTSEIYLCTYWYPHGEDSVYELISHSNDNGHSFSLRNNHIVPPLSGAPGALFSDSASGVVYKCPDLSPDTFSVSFDTGMTFIRKHFHHPSEPASGCLPGEILFRSYTSTGLVICRSTDYGSSFDTLPMADSLVLIDVGVLPGELYFEGYGTHTIIKVVTSFDYGATYQFHNISVPYYRYYDFRHGTMPGEYYLLVWVSPYDDYFYIYHTTDYGNTVTLQQTHQDCFDYFVSFIAGRKPGTFYVARRNVHNPNLYIDYSTDYGVTFTTYTHYLDSNYTGIVNRNDQFNIRVYPNPVSTHLNIELPKDNGYNHLQILNLFGQVSLQQEIKPGSKKVLVDVSKLVKGFYVLRLKTTANKYFMKKISCNNN